MNTYIIPDFPVNNVTARLCPTVCATPIRPHDIVLNLAKCRSCFFFLVDYLCNIVIDGSKIDFPY